MTEPIRLEEKYLTAAQSSNLKLSLERGCDVDLLIAAGMVRECLATELYRLRGQFDRAKGPIKKAQTNYRDMHARAAEQRELAAKARRSKHGDAAATAEQHDRAADEFAVRAEHEALTARSLALLELKSLDSVTASVGAFAQDAAKRRGFDGMVDVRRTAGHALDLLLDPLCGRCDGRGFSGGFGPQKTLCPACKGSGRRRVDFGSIAAQAFGMHLLAEMERKLARADELMLKFLRDVSEGRQIALDAGRAKKPSAELSRRLAELRSAQAQHD